VAWSIVGVGAVVEVTGTAHALTEPAGIASGDLLIACISSRIASTTPITIPAGWTAVGQQNNNNTLTTTSAAASGVMAYIIRGASAPALTFTHPTAPSVAIGRTIAYRNSTMALPDPWDQGVVGTTAVNTTAVSFSGFPVGVDGELMVAMMAGGQEAAWSAFKSANTPSTASGATDTTTAPSTTTWIERADTNTTTGADTSLAIFDAVKATKGATGNLTATASLGASHVLAMASFFGTKVLPTWFPGPGVYTLTGTAATVAKPGLPLDISGLLSYYAAPVGPFRLAAGDYNTPAIDTGAALSSGTGVVQGVSGTNTNSGAGQSFTNGGSSLDVTAISVYAYKTGSPADNLFVEITSTVPGGTVLATSANVPASAVTGSAVASANLITFTFASPPTIAASATFGINIKRTGARDTLNAFAIVGQSSSVYSGGSNYTWDGSTWSAGAGDLKVIVNGTITVATDAYYAIGGRFGAEKNLTAIKSILPDTSWSNIGTDQAMAAGAEFVYDISCYRVGGVLHIAAMTNENTVYYITYNMATETWGTKEVVQAAFDATASTGTLYLITSIVVRSDGSVIVAYQGPRVSTFSRVGYKIRSTAGTWGSYTALDAGAASTNYVDPDVVLGASDRVHFLFRDLGTVAATHRSLPSGGALSSANTALGAFIQYGWNPQTVSFDAFGTIKVFSPGWDNSRNMTGLRFDSGATPTFNTTATYAAAVADSPTRAFVDGTDIWVIHNITVSFDLYIAKSTDYGATFNTPVITFNSTPGVLEEQRGSFAMSQNGEVYIRGSKSVVPYFVVEVGQATMHYNEYTVRQTVADAWNTLDKTTAITLSNSDKTATTIDSATGAVRSSKSHTLGATGKYYFEFLLSNASSPWPITGIKAVDPIPLNTYTDYSVTVAINGNINMNASGSSTIGSVGATLATNDVVCMAVDFSAKRLWARKNSGLWNNDAAASPGSGTNGLDISALSTTNYALFMFAQSTPRVVVVRTEVADLTVGSYPSGFKSWMDETMAAPTMAPPPFRTPRRIWNRRNW